MKLYVKNMVCDRCRMITKNILHNLKVHYLSVELGEINLENNISPTQHRCLYGELQKHGFELVNIQETVLMDKIKESIHYFLLDGEQLDSTSLRQHLSNVVHINYQAVNNLFTEIEGISLERYYIIRKIERIRHHLLNESLSLSQIAILMKYPLVSPLVEQFKEHTGLSPFMFRYLQFITLKLS